MLWRSRGYLILVTNWKYLPVLDTDNGFLMTTRRARKSRLDTSNLRVDKLPMIARKFALLFFVKFFLMKNSLWKMRKNGYFENRQNPDYPNYWLLLCQIHQQLRQSTECLSYHRKRIRYDTLLMVCLLQIEGDGWNHQNKLYKSFFYVSCMTQNAFMLL